MNSLRLNGGMFNGARVIAALALVTCSASAQVNSSATYVHKVTAVVTSSANVVVNPVRSTYGNSSAFVGSAYFFNAGTHTQATQANLTGSAGCLAYLVNYAGSQADMGGFADALWIPASTFGYADVYSAAAIYADATKTHPGKGSVLGSSEVVLLDATAYRMVLGDIVGSVAVRVESGVNNEYEAYGEPTAYSNVLIEDSGLVTKQVGALIYGVAYADINGTHNIKTKASILAKGELSSTAVLVKVAKGNVAGTATVSAAATYVFRSKAAPVGTAVVNPVNALQKHTATGVFTTSSTISGIGVRVTYATCGVSTYGLVNALPLQNGSLVGNVLGSVEVSAVPRTYHHHYGQCLFTGIGLLSPIGYENLMSAVNADRTFIRPTSIRVFARATTTRTFGR